MTTVRWCTVSYVHAPHDTCDGTPCPELPAEIYAQPHDEFMCLGCGAQVVCIVEPSPFKPFCLSCQVDRLTRGVIENIDDVTPEKHGRP